MPRSKDPSKPGPNVKPKKKRKPKGPMQQWLDFQAGKTTVDPRQPKHRQE